MADKSRERNYVDMFSDYGLDERQKLINAEIGVKCFKTFFNGVLWLTVGWFILYIGLEGVSFPFGYVALSYYMLASVCICAYAIKASKSGTINGIYAFSLTCRDITAVIMLAAIAVIIYIMISQNRLADHKLICTGILIATALLKSIILQICGKRNFKVLDEKSADDTEETEEE
ncbi:MAG: hypothetical protein K2N60_02085 [Oscillospiraceae bacterium]|nr:hypothetical protein [Oscillospiraceae bacterium]